VDVPGFPPLLRLESLEKAVARQRCWKTNCPTSRLLYQPHSCLPRLEVPAVEAQSPTHIEGQLPGATWPAGGSRRRRFREGIDSTSAILAPGRRAARKVRILAAGRLAKSQAQLGLQLAHERLNRGNHLHIEL
jgi:hypothetical protein